MIRHEITPAGAPFTIFIVRHLHTPEYAGCPGTLRCRDAIRLAELGDYNEAVRQINTAIRMDSNNSSLWYTKGNILYNQGNYPDAVNSFGQAADIDPGFAEAWYNKGLALAALGKYSGAIHAFDKTLAINRNDKRSLPQESRTGKNICEL